MDDVAFPTEIPGPAFRTGWGRFRQMMAYGRDSIAMASRLFAQHGKIVALVKGGGTRLVSPRLDCPGTVIVYGPEFLKEVATNHDVYHKFHLSGRLHPIDDDSPRKAPLKSFGAGLFGVNEDEHKRHRKLMGPAFYPGRIIEYADDMIAMTDRIVSAWRVGETINLAREMQELAKHIASLCLFGEDLNDQPISMAQTVQDSLAQVTNPWTRLLPYDLPGLPYRKLLASARRSQENVQAIIARRRAESAEGRDVLSMLIREADAPSDPETGGLSEEQLIGHASVLFAAGHETSANALTWTLFLLSQHPQIARDLVEELRAELDGVPARPADFDRLPLLDRVVNESLRVLPPVPWNARITSRPTELGGYVLPAGAEVLASMYQTQRMPEIFSEPKRFLPSRWETANPSPYEFAPFSAGQRICIGAGFAMQEIKIALSMILQQFRLSFVHPQIIDRRGAIVVFPKFGMKMRLHPVDGNYGEGVGGVRGNVRDMVDLPE